MAGLEDRGMRIVMVQVTAPYDVPFRCFSTDPSLAADWNAHVATELICPSSTLPYFVCGFSGRAALAFNGVRREPGCFGGAALGALPTSRRPWPTCTPPS